MSGSQHKEQADLGRRILVRANMQTEFTRKPVLGELHQQHLADQDAAPFIHRTSQRCTAATFCRFAAVGDRLAQEPDRMPLVSKSTLRSIPRRLHCGIAAIEQTMSLCLDRVQILFPLQIQHVSRKHGRGVEGFLFAGISTG